VSEDRSIGQDVSPTGTGSALTVRGSRGRLPGSARYSESRDSTSWDIPFDLAQMREELRTGKPSPDSTLVPTTNDQRGVTQRHSGRKPCLTPVTKRPGRGRPLSGLSPPGRPIPVSVFIRTINDGKLGYDSARRDIDQGQSPQR